jgi:hypothetical protein
MKRIEAPYGPWAPATLGEVAALFSALPCMWWVAGGHAIDLAVGRSVRDHGDIDVMVLRRDQLHIQQILPRWQWWAVDPPGTLRPWTHQEHLPQGVHDIWCRPGPDRPWQIQVMLDESSNDEWVSRRDPHIRRPLATIGKTAKKQHPLPGPGDSAVLQGQGPTPERRDRPDRSPAHARRGPETMAQRRARPQLRRTSLAEPPHITRLKTTWVCFRSGCDPTVAAVFR